MKTNICNILYCQADKICLCVKYITGYVGLIFLGLLVALNEQFSRTIWTIRTSTLTGRVWGFKTFLALKDCFFVVKPLNESKSRWMRLC